MADFSDAKISLTLFEKKEEDRKSEKSPSRSGFVEITLDDLNEFFALCKNIEPELNYNDNPAIKLRIAMWDRVGRKTGKPYLSCSISPQKDTTFKMDPEQLISPPKAEPEYAFNDDALI
jgi:hypothetical protein